VIFDAVTAVESADACKIHSLLLAHIARPAVDRVAGTYSIAAELDGVCDHVVVTAAFVLDVCVRAHVDCPRKFLTVCCGGLMVA